MAPPHAFGSVQRAVAHTALPAPFEQRGGAKFAGARAYTLALAQVIVT